MPIISIYLGGPIPEMGDVHPQKYIESLGCHVSQFAGSMLASTVVMEIDKIPEPLPEFVKTLDDWPEWASKQLKLKSEGIPVEFLI
jgi:hypothetical protein